MCGTNGLFVGCPALSFCPLAKVDDSDCAEADGYKSPFRQWDERAAVRTSPRRLLSDGFSTLASFPEALVPALNHAVSDGIDETDRGYLKAQQLYRYLDFTTRLEHLVVNKTALGIAHGTIRIDVPDQMRFDAYYIYVDEAYHALFSEDLARQVRSASGIIPNIAATPEFMVVLDGVMAHHPGYENLIELLFVAVSETLITGNLVEVARSGEVDDGIADSVRDHATDEGRHHSYFRQFLRILWGQLSPAERRVAVDVYPKLVVGFTMPERTSTVLDLIAIGVSRTDAEDAVDELFSETAVREAALRGAGRSLDYFADLQTQDLRDVIEDQTETVFKERTRS
ncbi:P-aminobenzoate N-oxygenase AurF [Agreia bicolorata]|uniref:p-aminobenzoate N-oxygenase AurF n=1 Tax=Agreia bicolorata TaxID=110935 RepID=A0A1T4XXZ4_9MICO|nr:diiron oxygenase [Agreia bicolorata]SKA94088.1 P-aminobenzoate N-oxygenase AurF [Agreia bicolorata]